MRLVVVGGVAAGLSAASRARRLDPDAEIIVLEKGNRISYGACGLPYYIEGQVKSIDDLAVYSPEVFERDRNIRIRLRTEAVSVQHGRREVVLRDGERIRYDRLVWAAGARPARRTSARHIFSLHTDEDAARLKEFLERSRPRTAAVVGGGYIGLEMAGALRAQGLDVKLYHEATTLMSREDPWLTKRVVERLEQSRVAVHLNERVESERVEADLVVEAAGLLPNVEVMAEAGVRLGRTGAIEVNDAMETSVHGVFGAGDCCEARHLISGRPVWMPLGTTANKMGRVAGANAAGRKERFDGIAGTSIVRVCGWGVAVTGFSSQQARREGFSPVEAVVQGRGRAKYFHGRDVSVELVADQRSRRLLGAAVVGDEDAAMRINVVSAALAGKMVVETFAGLDLAYAPPYATVMDPLLEAARQLLRALD